MATWRNGRCRLSPARRCRRALVAQSFSRQPFDRRLQIPGRRGVTAGRGDRPALPHPRRESEMLSLRPRWAARSCSPVPNSGPPLAQRRRDFRLKLAPLVQRIFQCRQLPERDADVAATLVVPVTGTPVGLDTPESPCAEAMQRHVQSGIALMHGATLHPCGAAIHHLRSLLGSSEERLRPMSHATRFVRAVLPI